MKKVFLLTGVFLCVVFFSEVSVSQESALFKEYSLKDMGATWDLEIEFYGKIDYVSHVPQGFINIVQVQIKPSLTSSLTNEDFSRTDIINISTQDGELIKEISYEGEFLGRFNIYIEFQKKYYIEVVRSKNNNVLTLKIKKPKELSEYIDKVF